MTARIVPYILYKELEHLWVWFPKGSWNQSLEDTREQHNFGGLKSYTQIFDYSGEGEGDGQHTEPSHCSRLYF